MTDEAPKDLQGGPYRPATRDTDGNAKGGLRLPHMPVVLADGRKAGAPLGRYDGFAWAHETSNIFFPISGTFTPFPPDKIEALYPNHKVYVAAVAAAAEDLVATRYILPEDGAAYGEAAARSDIGRR